MKLTIDDLNLFVSDDKSRPKLLKPWYEEKIDSYIATNGSTLIKVPRDMAIDVQSEMLGDGLSYPLDKKVNYRICGKTDPFSGGAG